MNSLEKKASFLRLKVLEVMRRSGAGHLATAFSCTEIMTALYYGDVLRFDPKEPKLASRDRFLLSKGHAATMLYCVLADVGYFPEEELWETGKTNGIMGVHLQYDVPGIEATSGSLGNGLGLACGIALAAQRKQENYLTYVLLGDGELNEGSVWESLLFATHHRLNNLVIIIDRNRMCCAGYTENVIHLESLNKKLAAFGCDILEVDGHNCQDLVNAMKRSRARTSLAPLCIIAETTKGKGLKSVENDPMCHHYSPRGDALLKDIQEIEAIYKGGSL